VPSSGSPSGLAAAAGTWRLGDRTVNRMGFGAMRLTGSRPFHYGVPRDRQTSIAVLRRAVELGVDHIDTASFYFSQTRSANELINSALSPYPEDLTIVTKVGPWRDEQGEWAASPGPEGLRGHVQENLRQLGRDRMDVVNLRFGEHGDIRPHVAALADLAAEGLVGQVGISAVSLDQLEAALTVTDVVCVQNRFAVDAPEDLAILNRCGELGIAFVPFFALAGTGGAGGPADEPASVREVASEVGATTSQVRLAWTLALGDHVLAIPGTGSVEHLEENVAAAAVRLTGDQVERLSA